MPCSPVPIPGPFLPVWFYSFLEIHKHFYSLSKPDDALGGRNASLVCNLSHAYHFYDCAPPPRLPSYAGPPCAAGTTHDSFSQMCAYGQGHIACGAYGLGLLLVPLVSYSTYHGIWGVGNRAEAVTLDRTSAPARKGQLGRASLERAVK